MQRHAITFAAEISVEIEADSRADALRKLRAIRRADLWGRFDEASAMRGEPDTSHVGDATLRVIGRPA